MYSVVLMAALTAGAQTPDCHGSYSNCYGSWYGSCYGNCGIENYNGYGTCWGSYTCCGYASCCGYTSCWGSYTCNGSYPWDWSSVGCNGCISSYGISPYFVQTPLTAPPTYTEPVPPPKPAVDPKLDSVAPTKARLIVETPADAKLYIDDHVMKTQSEHRTYQTPDLEPGQTYFYEVRVELVRDGQTQSETKRVLVRAGQEAHADFNDLAATATAKAK